MPIFVTLPHPTHSVKFLHLCINFLLFSLQEAVVVVVPYYVKYGNICYTRCQLTFSQRCVRLEGSALCDRKRTLSVEWSTFDILNIEHQQYESVGI